MWLCKYFTNLGHGTSINVDPINIGGCHINNSGGEGLPPWHHSYKSTELLSALMPQASYPPSMIINCFFFFFYLKLFEIHIISTCHGSMRWHQFDYPNNNTTSANESHVKLPALPSSEDDSAYDKAQLPQLHME